MSDPNQPKMPHLKRTGPVRNWDGLFGAPRDGASLPNGDAGIPASAVSRGVDLGYRVIEEYIRQGEAFARSNGPPPWAGGPQSADPRRLTERMVEHASDLASAWLEFVQANIPAASGAPTVGTDPGGFDTDRAASARANTGTRKETEAPAVRWRTSIEIASKRRAEVTLDIQPGLECLSLRAHDLRARDGEGPRIRGIAVEVSSSDHRVIVRIAVPDDQPAATYTGVIVEEESNVPKGTLSVRILE